MLRLPGLIVLSLLTFVPLAMADGTVVTSRSSDPQMNSARQQARDRLDWFLNGIENGSIPVAMASLKVAVPKPDGGAEHLWVESFTSNREGFVGVIANDPVVVSLNRDDRYKFSRKQITDWMFWKDGKIHGGYTLRAMLPRLPKEEADELRALLAPLR